MREVEETWLQMGTIVHLRVVTDAAAADVNQAFEQARAAFVQVESVCSRFDEDSELRRLSRTVGCPTPVSDTLYQILRFALAVADETDGLFDPTVGRLLHSHGFNQHYLTGAEVTDEPGEAGAVDFRDVLLHPEEPIVTLLKPMTLDLGAVAKGFAVDLAAQVLHPFSNYLIDAGGDLYVAGSNLQGEPWHVGIRHPQQPGGVLMTLCLTDVAICTSGGYERTGADGKHHLVVPATGESPNRVLSSTVIAPFAMLADAFSTVTFLEACTQGLSLLEQVGLDGIIVDESLAVHTTQGVKEYLS